MKLERILKSDRYLQYLMSIHYSNPKGFVGRQLHYKITYGDQIYGCICAGSASRYLPGRNEFLGVCLEAIQKIINNTFFHLRGPPYPERNFASKVIREFREVSAADWQKEYGDKVLGFESLVEIPRTGECYKRDGWSLVGCTSGFTCKRESGLGTDSYSGKRVWGIGERKLVFCYKND